MRGGEGEDDCPLKTALNGRPRVSEGVAGFGGGRGGGRWQTLRTALNGRPGAWEGGGIGLGELGWWMRWHSGRP